MMTLNSKRRADIFRIIVLTLAAIGLSYLLLIQKIPLNTFEYGGYVNAANRMNSGQVIYRDFHFYYGPFVAYKAMLLSKLNLPVSIASRIYMAYNSIEFLVVICVFCVARKTSVFVSLLLLIAAVTFATGPSAFFVLYLMYVGVKESNFKYSLFAGFLATYGLWWYQDITVYVVATAITSFAIAMMFFRQKLTRNRVKSCGFIAVGFAIGLLVFTTFILVVSDLASYLYRCWWYTLMVYDKFSFGDFPSIFEIPDAGVGSSVGNFIVLSLTRWLVYKFIYIFPPAAVLVFLITRLLTRTKSGVFEIVLAVYATFLYRQVLKTGGDGFKLQFSLFPTLLLTLNLFRGIENRANKFIRFIPIGLVLLLTAYHAVRYTNERLVHGDRVSPVQEKYGSEEQLDLVSYITSRTDVQNSLVVFPNNPMVYVQCETRNPIKFDYMDPMISLAFDSQIADEIRQKHVKMIVVRDGVSFWGKWKFGVNFGQVTYSLIMNNYHRTKRIGGFLLFELNGSSGR